MKSLLVTIEGKQYDLSLWKDKHPGGKTILEQYHNKDATDIFQAMHGLEAYQKLNTMKGTPHTVQTEERIKAFRQLRKQLVDDGFFESNMIWYAFKVITTVSFLAFGALSTWMGYWIIGSILFGIGYQQLGWLGHDYCHHTCFQKNRKLNNFLAYIFGNVLSGFSVNWWKDRHNTHHAITNVLDADPDVDNLPLFVWSVHDIHRVSTAGGLAEYIIPYQHYYFIPFTPFLKLIWCLQSIFFVKNLEIQNQSYMKSLTAERLTLGLHYLMVLSVLMLCPSFSAAVTFFIISEFIGGAGIALIVFMNHYACEQLPCNDGKQADFLELQLGTTRNINAGVIMDWVAGGLNYQIEHHLFPTMPRHNLSKVKPIIEKFCAQHKLPYESLSFLGCLMEVENKLESVASTYVKLSAKISDN